MLQSQWMSRQEVAAELGLTLPQVDRLIDTGLLPRYRLRERYIRVRREDVEPLLDVPKEWLLRC